MKKIEAIIDPAALDTVKLRLKEFGIGERMTFTQTNSLNDAAHYSHFDNGDDSPWRPCLRLDLIVSDRQANLAVNIILQHGKSDEQPESVAHVNVFSLDATLETPPCEISRLRHDPSRKKPKGC